MLMFKINILIAMNDGYIKPIVTMLYSLKKNNPDIEFIVYILFNTLSSKTIKVLECEFPDIQYVFLDCSKYNNYLAMFDLHMQHISMETFYRLLLPIIIPETVERILWLDGDLIVNGHIGQLYSINFGDASVAAAEDMIVSHEDVQTYENLKLDLDDNYFNAGVVLYNLSEIRKASDSYQSSMERIADEYKGKLMMNDQDVLNLMYRGDKRILIDSEKYNFIPRKIYSKREEIKAKNSAIIIHFAGGRKPWNNSFQYPLADLYWDYRKETIFGDEYYSWKRKMRPYKLIPFNTIRFIRDELYKSVKRKA